MDNRIEKRVELKAPVSRVWRALTDYREFGEWFRVRLESPLSPDSPQAASSPIPATNTSGWKWSSSN